MNKSFILLDRNGNMKKKADIIVKFNFEERDYLVYSIDENEQNCQIFVSKIILNSERKYFIDSISPEEKNKLNNIVYNLVILTPTEAKKGNSFEVLSKNLFDKFSVKLSYSIPLLDNQEYYGSCSVAITNKLLTETASKFYDENLRNNQVENTPVLPTWTAPIEVTAPTTLDMETVDVIESITSPTSLNNLESPTENTLNSNLNKEVEQILPINENNIDSQSNSAALLTEENTSVTTNESNIENQQVQKLAIVSDPSLGLPITEQKDKQTKEAGFANIKYVVTGTICLVLAVVVVIAAYFLISNMK